jgi:hypothetical protein
MIGKQQQLRVRQLENKLDRACRDSGLSDEEKVRALAGTLVGTIVFSTVTVDYQRWKQIAKFAVYDILDGVSINTEEAMALCASELYASGDPYLGFARRVGTAPLSATKDTHSALRDRYKVALLAIEYGMMVDTLATRLGICSFEIHEILIQHRELFAPIALDDEIEREFQAFRQEVCKPSPARLRAVVCLNADLLPMPDEKAVAHALLKAAARREPVPPDRQAVCALINNAKELGSRCIATSSTGLHIPNTRFASDNRSYDVEHLKAVA